MSETTETTGHSVAAVTAQHQRMFAASEAGVSVEDIARDEGMTSAAVQRVLSSPLAVALGQGRRRRAKT